MDKQKHRPLLLVAFLPSLRFQSPSLDVLLMGTFEPELFGLAQAFIFECLLRKVRNPVNLDQV